MTETEIQQLQRIENGVYRQILGAPKYAPTCTLRGEIGASLMKRRIIDGRIPYLIEKDQNWEQRTPKENITRLTRNKMYTLDQKHHQLHA